MTSFDLLIATVQIMLFLAVPAGLFLILAVLRHRERRQVLDLIRAAIEAGRPLPPELIDALAGAGSRSRPDFRRGVMLIAVAGAIVLIGLCAQFTVAATGGSGAVAIGVMVASVAAIPACIGIALMLLSRGERT